MKRTLLIQMAARLFHPKLQPRLVFFNMGQGPARFWISIPGRDHASYNFTISEAIIADIAKATLFPRATSHRTRAACPRDQMRLLSSMAPTLQSAANTRTPVPFLCANSMNEPQLGSGMSSPNGSGFEWAPWFIVKVAALFLISGLAEIGGGWLVWQAVRAGKPWWWALLGSAALVVYGFLPTLQPLSDFGRLYAAYGGIFIVLSYAWGVRFDGFRLDRGDIIGSILALAGVCTALFWPRSS